MHKIVAKFGGTSVKTARAINNIVEIVKNNKAIKAVVVSAVGEATNLLVEYCNIDGNKEHLANKILQIHLDLIKDLGLEELKEEIAKKIARLNNIKEVDTKTRDNVLSLGEDLSSLILNAYFNKKGIKSKHIDAREFMLSDDNYGRATPQINQIKQYNFPQELFVTQGFIGASETKETTTLGRGGSDYSAAIVAEAMCANELLIYTDVAGVYTSDPNKIVEAKVIEEISFQEIAEMANFGAKVLHPATLEPCVRAKIPIRILSTFESEKNGTLINVEDNNIIKDNSNIRAITIRNDQLLVTIKSLKMLNAYGFLANIFTILSQHKISIDLITTSEVSVALTINNNNMEDYSSFVKNKELLRELEDFAEITLEENLTLVAIVGYGLTIAGVIQRILKAIEPHKIRLICYGASNSSISLLVPKEKAYDIAKLLHQQILGGQNV